MDGDRPHSAPGDADAPPARERSGAPRLAARIGLWLGPALQALALIVAPEDAALEWRIGGLAAWMATWWVTEALPLGVTGLLPIIMVPLLGAGSLREATTPYGDPIIFLFLGGFWLAAAVQRWRLHERIAYWTAGVVGMRPARIVAGFMLATAFLSMWMSNTAAVLLMLPMGVSVVELMRGEHQLRFGRGLMLGIAYAGSIGGLGTLIGTPPNAFLAAYTGSELGIDIGFAQWMLWAVPLVIVGLLVTWFLLARILFRVPADDVAGADELVATRRAGLGAITAPERRVAIVFALVAAAWLLGPLFEERIPWPGDPAIAIIGALLLFVLPSGDAHRPLLVWDEAVRIPWGVLLLFGGGLSLAAAMDNTGLADALGDRLVAWSGDSIVVLLIGAVVLSLVLTEFMSNTAATAILLPVLGSVAQSTGIEPLLLLVPAALMASCGFMMPAGTPPNAIAVGTGHVEARIMVRTGIWVNLTFIVLVVAHGLLMARFVW